MRVCDCVLSYAVVDTQKETGRESENHQSQKNKRTKGHARSMSIKVTVCVSVCVSALSCGCDAGAVGAAETNDLCTVTSAMHLLHTEQQ